MEGKTNYQLAVKYALIASLGGFLFGFETAVISGAEKTIQELWALSSFWQGFTVSASLIGTVMGSLVASKPAQKYGRKRVLLVVAVAYLLSAVGCATAHIWLWFVGFRFLGGLAVGVSSVVGPIYIAEIAPARIRGRLTGSFQLMIVLGIFVAYLTNFAFVGLGDEAWRWMLGIMVIPALAFFVLLNIVPESPRWLAINGKVSEAQRIFFKLGDVDACDKVLSSAEHVAVRHQEPLFQKKYVKPILYAVLLAMFNQLSGINAILYYAPRIFEMAGFSKSLAYLQPVFIGGANLLFTCLAMFVIDRFGRKKLLLIGSLGMVFFLGLVAYTFSQKLAGNMLILIYLIGFIAFFAFSQGAVIWVFISEIFPNQVRSKGSSLGSFTHWIMAAIISWLFPIIVEGNVNGGMYSFVFYALMMGLSFVFIWRFMPETKGKTLEQIQLELER